MKILFQILLQIIFPVFFLLGLGALLHRLFQFDLQTLSRLLTYLFLPTIIFANIYQNEMTPSLLLDIGGFLLIQFLLLATLAHLMTKVFKMDKKLSSTFKNSVVLNNSGNFGLPVSQLVFQANPIGASIQIMVMMFQNIITYTYGLMTAASTEGKGAMNIKEILKTPILYALILGLIFYSFDISIPSYIWTPLENIADAFLAVALITLGVQVAYPKLENLSFIFFLGIAGRLIIAPLTALAVIALLGIEGTIAQALFIASSFPMSRNSALFALMYRNYEDYAAQAVLVSTLLSSVTVTIVIYASRLLF
ncbi:AEC family transporter [Salibacterium aidingense]|uniref:AEC family transporter n=1 Tax=Salibacterium aidingense TaxID=384933 RepID=UPI003BC809E9